MEITQDDKAFAWKAETVVNCCDVSVSISIMMVQRGHVIAAGLNFPAIAFDLKFNKSAAIDW